MDIKVLGTGCAKCKQLYAEAEKAIAEAGVAANLSKVEKLDDIVTVIEDLGDQMSFYARALAWTHGARFLTTDSAACTDSCMTSPSCPVRVRPLPLESRVPSM